MTAWAACQWWGLKNDTGDRCLVFVTARNRGEKRYRNILVRRSQLLDAGVIKDGLLRVSSAARSVADAARRAHQQQRADALVIEAVQGHHTSGDQLAHWLNVASMPGNERLRRAMAAAETGAWSVPEAQLLALLATSTVLPVALANPRLSAANGIRLVTPDAYLGDVGLAVMVHSRAHHFDSAEWEATIAGDSGLSEHGVTVLGVTPRQLHADPAAVLARVERTYLALQRAGHRPRATTAVRPVS
ncbi:MAG TPA: hypothetical protein VFJ97_00240 [Dermatophilaceae bacterium]|nr:hypothetical protein [Dermatophilaceae bacterium]